MKNLNNEFVPYEEAVKLDALGFDEDCIMYWNDYGKQAVNRFQLLNEVDEWSHNYFKAPSFHQSFKWFRENYNLIFQIFFLYSGSYAVTIHKNTEEYMEKIKDLTNPCIDEVVDCSSYEEAELECLKKLIEIAKKEKK